LTFVASHQRQTKFASAAAPRTPSDSGARRFHCVCLHTRTRFLIVFFFLIVSNCRAIRTCCAACAARSSVVVIGVGVGVVRTARGVGDARFSACERDERRDAVGRLARPSIGTFVTSSMLIVSVRCLTYTCVARCCIRVPHAEQIVIVGGVDRRQFRRAVGGE
jgi:hypothetical protein